jgi:hypothetical protein
MGSKVGKPVSVKIDRASPAWIIVHLLLRASNVA